MNVLRVFVCHDQSNTEVSFVMKMLSSNTGGEERRVNSIYYALSLGVDNSIKRLLGRQYNTRIAVKHSRTFRSQGDRNWKN